MKNSFKVLLLTLVTTLCSSCYQAERIFDSSSTYNLVFETQYEYLCNYFSFENFAVMRVDIKSLKHDYLNNCLLIQNDKDLVLTNCDESNVQSSKLYIFLSDEPCWETTLFGKRKQYNVYSNHESVLSFLNSYDSFYIYGSYSEYDSITRSNDNSALLVNFKRYNLFPIKNNRVKLDDLLDFYKQNTVLPYDYNIVKECYVDFEEKEKRMFTDYFWNNMSENDLIDSFWTLSNNPPEMIVERYLE